MSKRLTQEELNVIKKQCIIKKSKENKILEKILQTIIIKIGELYYKILKSNLV